MDDKQIRLDRMRYTKNKTSSSFALLAILFNVIYFVGIYKLDVGDYYYKWIFGVSIIYNLIFMLTIFLCSEGVKNYKINFSVTMIVVGVLQLVRTQIIPKKAHNTILALGKTEAPAMTDKQYRLAIIFILLSAFFLIAGGIIGIIKAKSLKNYEASLKASNK